MNKMISIIYILKNRLPPDKLSENITFANEIHNHDIRYKRDNFYIHRVSNSFSKNNKFYKG